MSEIYGVGKWSKIQKTENVITHLYCTFVITHMLIHLYFYYVGKFAKSETAVGFLDFAPLAHPIGLVHFCTELSYE